MRHLQQQYYYYQQLKPRNSSQGDAKSGNEVLSDLFAWKLATCGRLVWNTAAGILFTLPPFTRHSAERQIEPPDAAFTTVIHSISC